MFCDHQNIYCYFECWENIFIVVMAQMFLLWGEEVDLDQIPSR